MLLDRGIESEVELVDGLKLAEEVRLDTPFDETPNCSDLYPEKPPRGDDEDIVEESPITNIGSEQM